MPQATTFETQNSFPAPAQTSSLDLPDGITKNVYIIRGLPGIGKSYLASAIVLHAIQQAVAKTGAADPNVARVCSESDHFVGPDGKFRLCMADFSQAQQSCMKNLREAVVQGVRTICIHHLYPSCEQYAGYMQMADDNGYRVQVVEIYCPSEQAVVAFHERQRKSLLDNYSLKECLRMWQSWEVDPEAVYLSPSWTPLPAQTQPQSELKHKLHQQNPSSRSRSNSPPYQQPQQQQQQRYRNEDLPPLAPASMTSRQAPAPVRMQQQRPRYAYRQHQSHGHGRRYY